MGGGINSLAVFVAAIGGWAFGALWYGLLGPAWMAALGKTRDELMGAGGKPSPGPYILSFVAELLMAVSLAGILAHLGGAGIRSGIVTGFLLWLGFVITTLGVNNAYAKRRGSLTLIDGGHWLGVLLLQGAILGWFAA